MPLGYYLAQGLIPIGPHSSDDEEGPCQLPDGRIVCGPHGRVVCGRCRTDYSAGHAEDEEDPADMPPVQFIIDVADTDPDGLIEDLLFGPERRRGTGQVIPSKFDPHGPGSPTEIFSGRWRCGSLLRLTHRENPEMILIMTDGACLNNGQPDPKAGWVFFHGLNASGPATASGRLESKGPFGDEGIQSSNRAEPRAVIAALGFRSWPSEGFKTLVIATDSAYVVEGSTKWASSWIRRGWKTASNADVKNKDLWEALLGEFERWKDEGLSIQFWRIPREWNGIADAAAKQAALDEERDRWSDVIDISFDRADISFDRA